MVVLAVSITTRSGKPLLSRQFRDITKGRVMELLSNFQNIVANSSRQHTFVEDEHVRYLYKPLDDFYIILITNRQSNIIQDMDTLNLFAQTVNSNLKGFSEEEVLDGAFDILGSFDEIISLGYKENLSLNQINTFLSMESHEEKIQEIIERSKEFEAAEERKRRAREISRREHEKKLGIAAAETFGQAPFHNSSERNMSDAYKSYYSNASAAAQQSYKHLQQQQSYNERSISPPGSHSEATRKGPSMKLGGKRDIIVPDLGARAASKPEITVLQPVEEKRTNNGILINIRETINAEITRDGAIATSELKGILELRVNDPELAQLKIILNQEVNAKDRTLQFKTHPKVDNSIFMSSKVISLKDPSKPFPSNDQSLGVLRWRKVGSADDNSLIPLQVSTWVSPASAGIFEVSMEFEITESYGLPLKDVRFIFPLYTTNVVLKDDSDGVSIESTDEEHGVILKVDTIEPGTSGVFSIAIEAQYEDALFPMNIVFSNPESSSTFSNVSISQVTHSLDEQKTLPFDCVSILNSDEYVVV
ncbi:HCL543Cp [Eremothecium sinecaudum]|uniref:Coatomer subunit delta n=1 Tax=Eremothecium sinecaudum TaxID=45286 RepID=A0A109UXZ7_9SACH|nr:HCL543Cp [Eremothecium sinecaudum]AMD19608.1 HCL543Cp [Eremothecium sinecaudum]